LGVISDKTTNAVRFRTDDLIGDINRGAVGVAQHENVVARLFWRIVDVLCQPLALRRDVNGRGGKGTARAFDLAWRGLGGEWW
jgi:hypothetical protein